MRKNKPKVGKWQEINAYECCNYVPTTTTTTTAAPTTTTTTSSSTSTSTTTTTTTSGPLLRWATGSAGAACSSSETLSFTYNNGSFCAATELTLDTTGIGGNGTNFYAFFEGNAFLCIVTSPTTAATSDNCIPTTC